jgi:hypothetical protein
MFGADVVRIRGRGRFPAVGAVGHARRSLRIPRRSLRIPRRSRRATHAQGDA